MGKSMEHFARQLGGSRDIVLSRSGYENRGGPVAGVEPCIRQT